MTRRQWFVVLAAMLFGKEMRKGGWVKLKAITLRDWKDYDASGDYTVTVLYPSGEVIR